jgi:hypothetical protein
VFCSLDELTTALEDWIKLWNEGARPFTWTKTAGQIIDRQPEADPEPGRRLDRPVNREIAAQREEVKAPTETR